MKAYLVTAVVVVAVVYIVFHVAALKSAITT